jgi:serine/threonine-protein kinase
VLAAAPAIAPAVDAVASSAASTSSADLVPGAAAALPAATSLVHAAKDAAKERRTREARERREARLAAAALQPRPDPPAATGIVRVAISPWGEVEVDGKPAGTSPPLTELSLSAGPHRIVVRNADLPSYSSAVNVSADQPVTVKHKF